MSEGLRKLLKGVSEDSELLRQLREDPESLGNRYGLSADDIGHLKRSTILLASAAITLPPITITASPPTTMTTSPITITVKAPD